MLRYVCGLSAGTAPRTTATVDGTPGIRQHLESAGQLDGLAEAYPVCLVPAR